MSGKSWHGDWGGWRRAAEVALVLLVAIALAMALSGCQTTQALIKAPEEWWVTTEQIFISLGEDLWSIVRLLIPGL